MLIRNQLKKIVVAPNAFKGTLTAMEAAGCMERGLKAALRGVAIEKIPLADGGDGTVAAVVAATGGREVRSTVSDPLGRQIRAVWGLSGDGRTAVIEMAAASGLTLLKPSERNPMITSTFGTGELIRSALNRKVEKILIGIGGSATVDGGMGMARALGVRFLDRKGADLKEGGGSLRRLAHIDMELLDKRLKNVEIVLACDVDNPLTGPNGAAHIYGPQKGATLKMAQQLDAGLCRFAEIIKRDMGINVSCVPGSGAAGGLGAGLIAFLDAKPRSGAEIILDIIDLPHRLHGCNLVVTGEGRLDVQTISGKAPAAIARTAKTLGIPVIAICGSVAEDAGKITSLGIQAYFSSLEEAVEEDELKSKAAGMLERCAEQVGRLIAIIV